MGIRRTSRRSRREGRRRRRARRRTRCRRSSGAVSPFPDLVAEDVLHQQLGLGRRQLLRELLLLAQDDVERVRGRLLRRHRPRVREGMSQQRRPHYGNGT